MRRQVVIYSSFVSVGLALVLALGSRSAVASAPAKSLAERLCDAADVPGGLCVMAGCQDSQSAAGLANTGRFLVHAIEFDRAVIAAMQMRFHELGVYGLASVEELAPVGKLPYTENLVNAVIVGNAAAGRVPLAEVARVLRPGGVLFTEKPWNGAELTSAGLENTQIVADGLPWRCVRKPWPKEMDQWSHPRHAADGNAVSHDERVGPPRRVRWVTGPQQEISNMVAADGRCFFAGVLARDGFNGLRLWEQKLNPSPARGGFVFGVQPGSVPPVATGKELLVLTDKMLRTLDASTGKQTRAYPEAGLPSEILVEGGRILAVDKETIRTVDFKTARLCWKQDAAQPRYTRAGDGMAFYVEGNPRPGGAVSLVCRELASGKLRWKQKDLAWMPKVRGCVYHQGLLACEISTLADEKLGNEIRVLSATDGALLWNRVYVPGSSHKKQARAMFVRDLLWVLEAKGCTGLDPRTGAVRKICRASSTHCFPPVASTRYLFAGEMDLTDLATGQIDGNPITKTACSRDAGVVPANGLIYTFPKHCICWPMLRDYAALAPARPGGMPRLEEIQFTPEPGPALPPKTAPPEDPAREWPCYRHDAVRSGGTVGPAPRRLRVLWTAALGGRPGGAIAEDWRANYFIRGPLGPPVVAGGLVYAARPDAHQVVALDVSTGRTRWTFTANGRVDTAPTIHRGLCLFGSKSGWVYCLRADDGALVWRLRAAPLDERIVAYGQIESPWPVPGSVLVADDVAYFAAGRQPLADGGILVFAVDPACGKVRWVQRLDRVPQTNFYDSSGLEFDNFDLLHREGDSVAMSRWLFDRATGKVTCQAKSGFARLATGGSGVMFPRGSWSYAPRNESEQCKERPYVRPLAVFRDNALYGCSQDRGTVFRRDFQLADNEKFNVEWFKGWDTYAQARKGGDLWRSQRVARGAVWSVTRLGSAKDKQPISAMILAADTVCVASSRGVLSLLNAKDGNTLCRLEVPSPAWDGMAVAGGRIFLSTEDGRLLCLGERL